MHFSKAFTLLALIACGAATASAKRFLLQDGAAAAATTCPLDPSTKQLDFSNVAKSCNGAANVCDTCICSLIDAFEPAFIAGGVTYDPASPQSFDLAKAAAIMRACAESYATAMTLADVDLASLAKLTECTFNDTASVPSCLAAEVADLTATPEAAEASTTTATAATAGTDDLSTVTLPAASRTPLRIATVQSTPEGPQFTLVGEMSSAGQLLKVMSESQELLAAMSPEAVGQLQAMAADPSKIDANPGTAKVLNALENPINGAKLLSELAALNTDAAAATPEVAATQGAAPAAAPATPAEATPAPAPASGAAASSVAAAATIGAAMLAVMLL